MLEAIKQILKSQAAEETNVPQFGDFDLNHNLKPIFEKEVEQGSMRKAAALIPLVLDKDEIFVFMTKRPANFKAHPNLWCFPGGKQDATDSSSKAAALREANEEIGITSDDVTILGKLPNFWVCSDIEGKSGFNLSPYVGVLKEPLKLTLNPDEVVETIKLPLTFILDKKNCSVVDGDYCFNYKNAVIKGASPALLVMLRNLMPNHKISNSNKLLTKLFRL